MSKSLFEKTDIAVTYQTEHNFYVDDIATESLHSEHNPDRLFCNIDI